MQILHVVGARPNFIKLAAVHRAIRAHCEFQQTIVHTGQHFDFNMSDVFFHQLDIPEPDFNVGVRSTADILEIAEVLQQNHGLTRHKPDLLMIYGDVNSTAAAAIVGRRLRLRIAHVEAGLRSFDPTMREERNRILADHNSDFLFTPSDDADENLLRENMDPQRIHRVGNVMIDTLVRLLPNAECVRPHPPEPYALVTLHRPSNVDDERLLRSILGALTKLSRKIDVMFPVHPRTRRRLELIGYGQNCHCRLHLLDPLPYLKFLSLQKNAAVVITDSGGIQEETTYLNVPCLTLRDNTERPITITHGTNKLIGRSPELLEDDVSKILTGDRKFGSVPPLWDGHASERIVLCIRSILREVAG